MVTDTVKWLIIVLTIPLIALFGFCISRVSSLIIELLTKLIQLKFPKMRRPAIVPHIRAAELHQSDEKQHSDNPNLKNVNARSLKTFDPHCRPLRRILEEYDADRSGSLEWEEFKKALHAVVVPRTACYAVCCTACCVVCCKACCVVCCVVCCKA